VACPYLAIRSSHDSHRYFLPGNEETEPEPEESEPQASIKDREVLEMLQKLQLYEEMQVGETN